MTINEWIGKIVEHECEGYSFYYDIREMQNVLADDVSFPAAFMDEYYGLRMVDRYGWRREYTIELHWLDLCDMHGEAIARERIREAIRGYVRAFLDELKRLTQSEFKEVTLDPEPPMFDANATGLLLRVTFSVPDCMEFADPYPRDIPTYDDIMNG